MQKKYKYLAIAIFLCVICTMAITITYANTNALTKVQITNGTAGMNQYHANDVVEWRIHVHSWLGETNSQPNLMTNLTIIDVLPPGETFVSSSNWTSNGTSIFTVTNNGTYNQILKWDFGNFTFQADPEVEVHYNVTLFSNLPDGTFLINEANWSALVWDPYALRYVPQYASGEDSITVVATPSTISTNLNASSPITVGTPFQDSATLGGFLSNYSMANDNANVTFYWSADNIHWTQLGTPISAPWNGGSVNSIPVVGLGSGTYYFKANYTGNFLYKPSESANASEIMVITPTYSTTTTLLNNTSIVLGGTVHDTANVTFPVSIPPYPVPTGTVTFSVQWPNGTWAPLGTVSTVWDNNTKQYYAVSADFKPLQTGTYHFNATYSGDGNYNGSYGTFDSQNEILNVAPATPTVTTLLNTSTITLGQSIYDNVTVTGLGGSFPIPTGFALFQNNDTGSWVTFANVTLVNGKATSTSFTPTHTGTFYFQAVYSGDGNYTSVTSNPATEILTVGKIPSTVTTQLNASTITLGLSVYDNATVTGSGPTPTGFVLFYNNDTGSWVQFANVTLVNGVASFATFTPTHVGLYYFNVTYSGDSNYNGSILFPLEVLNVTKAVTSITTNLNSSTITLGSSIYDNATVTYSGPTPTGFVLFQNNDTGTWVTFSNVTLVNGKATSSVFTPLHTGTFYFQAVYSGDGNYLGSTSNPATEVLNVTKGPSQMATYLNTTTIVLGNSAFDTANVTFFVSIPPFPVPTGTITFQVEWPNGTWQTLGTVTGTWDAVNNRFWANSPVFTPTQTGTYYFNVTYSGDGNYTGSNELGNSDHQLEVLVVNPATPLVQTIINATSITLSQSITDKAIIWGLPNPPYPVPTGNVTFWYNGSNNGWVYFDNETLVNGVATSMPFTPPFAGIFYFKAIYTGDGNYTTANSGELSEQLVVQQPTPTIVTTLSSNPLTIGGAVYDNATISGYGSLSLTGAYIQFWYMAPGGTWTALGLPQLVTNANGGTFSSIYLRPNTVGNWDFMANYTGNNNYLPGASANEPLSVQQATPCVSTNLSAVSITLGTWVYDNATVTGYTGLPVPTGTVTFQYNITGSWVTYDTETLINGMATSIPFTPTQTGTYHLRAVYSGDAFYIPGTSGPDEEFLIVNVNPTTIVTTTLNATTTILGTSIYDTAMVTAPPNSTVPTGTVTFFWELSGGSWAALGTPVNLTSGVAQSPTFTPNATGTYYFSAFYSGDSNHNNATSTIPEVLTVTPATPGIQTLINGVSAQQTITLGQTAFDKVVVWGLPNPPYPLATGTVQFYWELSGGSWNALGSPVTLAGASAVSPTFQPNATGTYYFLAVYSGDSNYVPQNSSGYPETLTVNPSTPAVATWLTSPSITLGQSVTDNVIVWGLPNPPFPIPTGTVQFYWELSGGSWNALGSPVSLVNGIAVAPTFQPNATGTYYFKAGYSGDTDYNTASSIVQEVLTVGPATPSVQTILNATNIVVNQSVTDNAIVWGLPNPPFPVPTGTVQFYWELSGGSWNALGSPVTMASGSALSPTFTANQTGTYYFMAAYSGDSSYNATNSGTEVLTVNPAIG